LGSTGDDATPPPDAARLLALSDERDQWERLAREMWLDGYAAGHAGGHREGYEQAVREWKVTAAGLGRLLGPQWEELDRLRYPPGGRQSWITRASSQEGAA
jgi:hypothetical protein